MTTTASRDMGVVVIGRNEGDRLRRCLHALVNKAARIVYVDSGSTDDSVAMARALGVDVVELDMATPFTAARARNAGLARLTELAPDIGYVHFFDGDCEVLDGWLDRALAAIDADSRVAVVWGLLRERHPEKSLYNRLCDLEWKWSWPYGEVDNCGGISLMRIQALGQIGGFDPKLIAGEEPELAYRLRKNGWKIFRIEAEMALHDADMTRFSQWWRRGVRAGHAYAEGAWLHGRTTERYSVRETRSIWFWGLGLPVAALAPAGLSKGWSLLLLAGFPLLGYRVYRFVRSKGAGPQDAFLYAAFCVLSKFPAVVGQVTFLLSRLAGKPRALIEYK